MMEYAIAEAGDVAAPISQNQVNDYVEDGWRFRVTYSAEQRQLVFAKAMVRSLSGPCRIQQ
jgi:hypothetical protein